MDFRTEYARHPDDPSYQRLVDELTGSSEVLRGWWAEHADPAGVVRFGGPPLGHPADSGNPEVVIS
jgi:hypothetical protein